MLFIRFSHRLSALRSFTIHMHKDNTDPPIAGYIGAREKKIFRFGFTAHLSHAEYVSNDRITTIYNICSIFISLDMRSFIIVVYFMRCVIYSSRACVCGALFSTARCIPIHSYKLKHDRQSCRRQLCHLAGFKNTIQRAAHANVHKNGLALQSTTSATGFGGIHRSHSHIHELLLLEYSVASIFMIVKIHFGRISRDHSYVIAYLCAAAVELGVIQRWICFIAPSARQMWFYFNTVFSVEYLPSRLKCWLHAQMQMHPRFIPMMMYPPDICFVAYSCVVLSKLMPPIRLNYFWFFLISILILCLVRRHITTGATTRAST